MADLRTSWPASFRDAQELPPEDVGALVEALIAELDRREPDPNMEVDDPPEHDGTHVDRGYAEWDSLHSNIRRRGGIDGKVADSWASYVLEDAEDDDPHEDDDPGGCEHDGREPEAHI